MIGQNFKNTPLVSGVAKPGGRSTLRVRSPVDGHDRVGSAAGLNGYPIVVVATRTMDSALAEWRAQTQVMIAAACLLTLAIGLTLLLIVRQISRQSRDAQERLQEQKRQLDTALNNMTQGLVPVRRRRAPRAVQPALHRHVRSVGRDHQARLPRPRRDASPRRDRFVRRRPRRILRQDPAATSPRAKSPATLSNSADGRWFQIVNQPLPHGGWVVDHRGDHRAAAASSRSATATTPSSARSSITSPRRSR